MRKLKGTEDILPGASYVWQYVEDTARAIFDSYQYKEIRTPMFEAYELFARSVGETTDVVSKEMYDFYDKGERHIALRPEGTAGVVRAYVENKLFGPEHAKPYKVYYNGPMFRYERPQAGRQRQFTQIGAEVFGSTNPAIDAEAIALTWDFFTELGIENITLYINSLGKTADRQAYRQALVNYFEPLKAELSEDSQRRLHDNPLRILDSKDPRDKALVANAPTILDYLSDESHKHFEEVKAMLTALEIPFTVNPLVVRGLDYYQDTIFEIMVDDTSIGAQSTICGGGRYDGLVEQIGGPQTPSFGFGIGLERLILLLEQQQVEIPEEEPLDVYVIGLGEETNQLALQLVQAARKDGLLAERDYMNRSLKAQFKAAAKLKAKLILTVGEEELAAGTVQMKNQESGKQVTVKAADLFADFLGEFRRQTVDTSVIDKYFRGE
ncbi:histidine--tRNA ligase [Aerococcaceae bacterium NML210727]|nr:histidine--tRNA ligase [Aerococcaceae bacterium NML210727]MCW6654686.1 histidine--tRNA ligase [Aerococcaceae bacterium NML201296]MCW6664715.1 histidine--tRNA ligase [Aerococcaceae bacterium NML191219]MCW6666699.1 histidine--tRNA ligase [Aerococcaceae bacterium NML190938]